MNGSTSVLQAQPGLVISLFVKRVVIHCVVLTKYIFFSPKPSLCAHFLTGFFCQKTTLVASTQLTFSCLSQEKKH